MLLCVQRSLLPIYRSQHRCLNQKSVFLQLQKCYLAIKYDLYNVLMLTNLLRGIGN